MSIHKIRRQLLVRIRELLDVFPIVAIIGPRQCGKSTLSKMLLEERKEGHYLDLERPSDLAKLENPEFYLQNHKDRLVCLDEIQRAPELFPVLRSLVDEGGQPGQYLILGSASPELIRQSSESLAGRIAYIELTPFTLDEIGHDNLEQRWLRGGFPRSYLAPSNEMSFTWRESFSMTFLEKDIPNLGFSINPIHLRRLWQLLAHNHGQQLNYSTLGNLLGVSHVTVKSHVDLLIHTFMVRSLPSLQANIGKRIIKTPKTYLRDTGMLHYLLGIEDFEGLLGSPYMGVSWEGLALEYLGASLPRFEMNYLRTSAGAEVDLVLQKGAHTFILDFKTSLSPKGTKGFHIIREDLKPKASFLVAPVEDSFEQDRGLFVVSPKKAVELIQEMS